MGDIVALEAGDMIPADGRLVENYSLQVNESALTGESEAVHKHCDAIDKEELALGDQVNMVFSGSMVTYGRAFDSRYRYGDEHGNWKNCEADE